MILNSSIVGFNFNLGLAPILLNGASGSVKEFYLMKKYIKKLPFFKTVSGTSVMKLLAPSGSGSAFFYEEFC